MYACISAALVTNFNHSLPGLTLSDLPLTSPDSCPTDFLCTEEEVYSLLSTLDTTKANGHDHISARMLKETALSITPAVTELFNISIRLGELPDEWKISHVSPIPKSDNHSDPGSYHPISLLSILSELEKHICDSTDTTTTLELLLCFVFFPTSPSSLTMDSSQWSHQLKADLDLLL